uniref:Uncharacterized protein n=1 Tax=Angiostrongylus cantonensis TaxID=6313 RepID=A0A0K0CVE1_ANGCA
MGSSKIRDKPRQDHAGIGTSREAVEGGRCLFNNGACSAAVVARLRPLRRPPGNEPDSHESATPPIEAVRLRHPAGIDGFAVKLATVVALSK